jgi:hypothetical protein
VALSDLQNLGGITLLSHYYNDSLPKAVCSIYPSII